MQAGLFSAVTSAFIVDVNSRLQPDPNEETAALLRVLIYKIDATTFGNDVPTIPEWSGPPRSIVQVQTMLYASLVVSLFSSFLAMLGKQWLNRYISTDLRGTAIERSQNRQRKLDGMVSWHFECVMESLPLMLQAALLLVGCGLSRYLWEINTAVASVILAITSFGVLFYLLTAIAGAASMSCPYKTPGSYLLHSTASAITSVLGCTVGHSKTVCMFWTKAQWSEPWWSRGNIMAFLKRVPCKLPGTLVADTSYLGQVMVHLFMTSTCQVYTQLLGVPSTAGCGLGWQRALQDLRCISWALVTSPEKTIHLSTLESLATMAELADFDPALVVDCLNILIGCVKVINGTVVVTQGSEKLATVSAMCLLRTFSHLLVMDPKSGVLGDVHQLYSTVFPPNTNFKGFPFQHTLGAIHSILHPDWNHPWLDWRYYEPSSHEYKIFSHALVKLTWFEYQRKECDKRVPGWILRFVLHSLSLDPMPSTTVIVDCLSVIAIDLGCNVSNVGTTIFDESSMQMGQISVLILQKLKIMNEAANPGPICFKHKAITVFFLYGARQEWNGQQKMLNIFLDTARASGRRGFMWHRIIQPLTTLLGRRSPVSLKQAIILVLPHLPWWNPTIDGHFIQLWAAAAQAVPYTDDIGQCVADTLLLIASQKSLQSHIPIDMWLWLNKHPSLSPTCMGGSQQDIVQEVQKLGNIETIVAYLLFVWSECNYLYQDGVEEMCTVIRKDFSGVGMRDYQEGLLEHLDHILGRLDLRPKPTQQYKQDLSEEEIQAMKGQYGQLREVLLEVDKGVMNTLTCEFPKLDTFFSLLT